MIDPAGCHRGSLDIDRPLNGLDRRAGIGSIRIVHQYLMRGRGMEETAEPPSDYLG